jgi:hypothetical protein
MTAAMGIPKLDAGPQKSVLQDLFSYVMLAGGTKFSLLRESSALCSGSMSQEN